MCPFMHSAGPPWNKDLNRQTSFGYFTQQVREVFEYPEGGSRFLHPAAAFKPGHSSLIIQSSLVGHQRESHLRLSPTSQWTGGMSEPEGTYGPTAARSRINGMISCHGPSMHRIPTFIPLQDLPPSIACWATSPNVPNGQENHLWCQW